MLKKIFLPLWHLPRNAAIALLDLYQQTLSPDHGPLRALHPYGYCRHEPTCSQYAKLQLDCRGFVIGCVLATGRVLSCHPWRKPDAAKVKKILDI